MSIQRVSKVASVSLALTLLSLPALAQDVPNLVGTWKERPRLRASSG